MIFSTPYNRPKSIGQVFTGKSMTEKVGYVPANQLIESMILAGRRLNEYRASQYDFPDGKVDDNFTDPTRVQGFDLADATIIQHKLENDLPDKIQEIKEKARQEALEKSGEDADQSPAALGKAVLGKDTTTDV